MSRFEGEIRVHAEAWSAILASRWNPRIVDAWVNGASSNKGKEAALSAVEMAGLPEQRA